MKIENRLFPYPVLCEDNDDYENCSFNVETKFSEDLNDININFEIGLDNAELKQLIRNGDACYLIHIECTTTSYRTTVIDYGSSFSYKIPKDKVNKDIYFVGMIVAQKNIEHFHSKNLNEDYEDDVSFDKGAILAYKNLKKIIVIKNYEELAAEDSIFTVVCKINEDNENSISFDITDDKIKIFAAKPLFDEYAKFNTNPEMRPILIALFVFPALIYTIEAIREESQYTNCSWYQKLKNLYSLNGKNFVDDVIYSNESSVILAQQILKGPIGIAITKLSAVIEE